MDLRADRSAVLSSSSFTSFNTSSFDLGSEKSSEPSLYTTTTSRTIWGPGALAGKALLALGKWQLRGIEEIVILRRLAAISSRFPHTDDTTATDMEQVYDDTLELTRPGLYGSKFRQQALRLLLKQIASGNIAFLIKALVKWPTIEIGMFISEVMACMHPRWTGLEKFRQKMHVELMDDYISSQYNNDGHGATPFVNFIRSLSLASTSCCKSVMETGFLDLVLCMYLHDFIPSAISPSELEWKARRSSLIAACTASIEVFATSSHPEIYQMLFNHPLYTLWPKDTMSETRFIERRRTWRTLDNGLTLWRLGTILNVIFLSSFDVSEDILDALDDLLEFSSSDIFDTNMSALALKYFFGCIGYSTGNVEKAFSDYLERNLEGTTNVLSRVITCILNFAEPTQKFRSFLPDSTHGEIVHPIDNFVEFAIRVVGLSDTSNAKQTLLDAGILSLLLAMLGDEVEDRDILSDISNPSSTDTRTLLDSIRLQGVRPHFKAGRSVFPYRRRILCDAFRVFYDCGDVSDSNTLSPAQAISFYFSTYGT